MSSASTSIPAGDPTTNDYVSRTGQSTVPVQKDEAPIDDPIDAKTADSDATLAQDDKEAIDPSNMIGSRTRGATKESYAEPGDEEGLPANDGTSAVAQ